jgi:V/A-type H+/Na+-transporting ATPase subunit E
MAIEDVKKQIVSEAEKQAQQLEEDAKLEAQRIEADVKRDLDEHKKELKENAEQMLTTLERRELATADFEGRRMILDKKREIIERVLEEAKKELAEQSAAKRKEFLAQLLKKAEQEIDVKTVYVDKKDKTAITDKKAKVKEADINGGLIAETEDGKVSVNLTVDALLEQVRDEHLQKLGEVLFS